METIKPGYLELYASGELAKRAAQLEERLESCDICPHKCGINRLSGRRGFCRSGKQAALSSYCAHNGEEPALSGSRGSGTLFFGNCNMRCVYCQNYQISQEPEAQRHNEIDCLTLARRMLYLQDELGCHNINLVSPTHFVPQIVRTLLDAIPLGLHIPLVYNSGGYDSPEIIRSLEGIIDIYLPDMRYSDSDKSLKYSQAPEYTVNNRAAIREMYRQVGNLQVDRDEIAFRGVIVRHLILPNGLSGSRKSLTWLAREVSPEISISVMSQYFPCYQASRIPELGRTITYEEYQEVVNLMENLGLENGWLQEMDAPSNYLPDFSRREHPFE